ncbi:MAG TPA: hypothetical protein VN788_15230 [Verrucomicrobiae bacterium]|nr:hypothetical protein [Verrucomicrobiae bacterium]
MAMRKDQLRDAIRDGAVLIKDGTLLPESLRIENEPCVPGWGLVQSLNGYAFDRKVRETGWTFFCLAGEIGTIVLGTDEQFMLRRAIKRILANSRSSPFNSLEITRVARRHFLGLPYLSVGAQSRHVQESMVLLSAERTRESTKTKSTVTPARAGSRVRKDLIPKERAGMSA